MHVENTFTVPSYYKDFTCKAGDCRHTCCEGLSINITQKEYHRLVGLNCSKALREKLDLALYVLSHPDEYKYACISPTYTGRCRMLDENGLCSLQKECGADILTCVCKYYPRHPVITDFPECSMANACEATLELFLDGDETWGLDEVSLDFLLADMPIFYSEASRTLLDTAPSAEHTPLHSVNVLPQNSIYRHENIRKLSHELTAIMADSTVSLTARLQKIRLTAEKGLFKKSTILEQTVYSQALIRLLQFADKEYPDLALPAHRAVDFLSEPAKRGGVFDINALNKALDDLQEHFSKIDLPVNFNRFFSKVLANGMFYHGFPFGNQLPASRSSRNTCTLSSLQTKFAEALTVLHYAVYLLTILLFANKDSLSSSELLVDLTAAFSRMADLSDFDRLVLAAHTSHDSDFPGGISA